MSRGPTPILTEAAMDEPTISVLAERLGRLEIQCGRWRRACTLLGLLAGLGLVAGIAGARLLPEEVEAKRFVARDSNGNSRIEMGVHPRLDIPYLTLKDRDGTVRISIEASEDQGGGSRVFLFDRFGNKRA